MILKVDTDIVMVLILDGNSEIGAHVWSEIGAKICLRHLFRSTAVAGLKSLLNRPVCLPTGAPIAELPSDIVTADIVDRKEMVSVQLTSCHV